MIKCSKCGKETGPAFGMCGQCLAIKDLEWRRGQYREKAILAMRDCKKYTDFITELDAQIERLQK